ncbi:RNA polymerase sigma factor, partial [Kineococcus esterisolvens]|uniref:RNA polymerase sigma factor n=1 Tax=Kineococcus sp. SYSU DK015 TaxID=3383136 RepID=UPI003D7E2F29
WSSSSWCWRRRRSVPARRQVGVAGGGGGAPPAPRPPPPRAVADRKRPLPDPAPEGPEERAVRSAEHRLVLAALDALPVRQREVLVLRYSADLSEQDIAEALGISRGAVKTHAHRGLAALRAGLRAQEETP